MKKKLIFALGGLLLIFTACNQNTGQKTAMENSSNPLLKPSTLPFQVPDFTQIKDSDFAPAFEEGIKEQLTEVEKIANNPEDPTFDNTLVALEKSGQTLARVNNVFGMLTGANTDSVLQKLQEDVAPKLASLRDSIFLNEKLFERVQKIYQKKDELSLDPESAKLLQFYHDEFIRAGANLSEADKSKLKELNQEIATLRAQFKNQLLAAGKAGGITFDDKAALKGLSEGALKAAAQKADANGEKGKWRINLQNTTQQPVLQSLENRKTREEIFKASWTRAEKGDKNDTRNIIKKIAIIPI